MLWLTCALVLTAAFPLYRALKASRRSTLLQAIYWAWAAWAVWLLTFVAAALGDTEESALGRHLALSLTGCAGVAVLGARRPGVKAWNFVVCGLLAVLLLPIAQGLGRPRLETEYRIFLAVTLLVGLTNYLPTRAGPAALLAGLGCGLAFFEVDENAAGVCLALSPWAAMLLLGRRRQGSEADVVWLDFRDRFGVVWGQRVREQMNRAAANAGWPVTLTWHGLEMKENADVRQVVDTLRALLKRFEVEEVSIPGERKV
jgi:hypothetical protein